MTKFLIALICCLAYLFSANTSGANITAVSSGNWTVNSTWSCNSTISVIAVSFEPSFKRIDVFPNPMAGNDLHVKLNFHPEEGSRSTLNDNAGALVLQKTLKADDQINVLSLPTTLGKGLYHMSVVTRTMSFRSKIIIQ